MDKKQLTVMKVLGLSGLVYVVGSLVGTGIAAIIASYSGTLFENEKSTAIFVYLSPIITTIIVASIVVDLMRRGDLWKFNLQGNRKTVILILG